MQNTLLFEAIGLTSYFVIFSLLFLIVALVATVMSWAPVFKMQEKTIGCTEELYAKDPFLYACLGFLFVFALFSLFLTLLPVGAGPAITDLVLITLWIFLFGVSFDLVRAHMRRLFSYTRYSFITERLEIALQKLIRREKEPKAVSLIGVLLDSIGRACDDAKISRVSEGLSALRSLIDVYTKEIQRLEAIARPRACS